MKKLLGILCCTIATNSFADKLQFFNYADKIDNLLIKSDLEGDKPDQVYFNHKLLNLAIPDNDQFNLQAKSEIGKYTIYMLSSATHGVNRDPDICKFITTQDHKTALVSVNFPCPIDYNAQTINLVKGTLQVKIHNYAAPNYKFYADENDIAIYSYDPTGNKITKIQDFKSDAYYRTKYAKITAAQIYQIADKDSCVDDEGELSDSGVCNQGAKYCAILKFSHNIGNDKDARSLKKFCAQ